MQFTNVTVGRGLCTASLINLWQWRRATTWQFGGRVQYCCRGGIISERQLSIHATCNDCGTPQSLVTWIFSKRLMYKAPYLPHNLYKDIWSSPDTSESAWWHYCRFYTWAESDIFHCLENPNSRKVYCV